MKSIHLAISKGSCLLNLAGRSMPEILESSVDYLVQSGRLAEELRDVVTEGLRNREQQDSTVIGHGCAVPHMYDDRIAEPTLLFVRLRHPVNLGAPDGVATQFLFVMIGPTDQTSAHLDLMSNIARLMSDNEFGYQAAQATSQQAVLDAIEQHVERHELRAAPPTQEISAGLRVGGRPFAGIAADLRRRIPHYIDDFKSGFQGKCVASIVFMFFACLAPAVTFGGVLGDYTGGQIGAIEMLVATAGCGIFYALFAGQPLIILGGVGQILIFTVILFRLCEDMDLADHFLGVYGWIGLWTALFTVLLAVTNASNLMKYFTRFTDEIFSVLMSLIFIYEASKAIVHQFQDSFADELTSHDSAFLALLLTLGTFYIAMSLAGLRRSYFLVPWMREFLADFGPTIALAAMAAIAWWLRDEVALDRLQVQSTFGTTSGRPWLVDFGSVPMWARFAAIGPALLATVLIYLTQNITARLINNPQNKLQKGESYHWDLAISGGLIGVCSLFGLPWLGAATVRSLAHVRALSNVQEVTLRNGTTKEQIVHVNENRLTALAIHLLVAASLLCLPLFKIIPMATLYGIFLFMGVISLRGVQFLERVNLWIMDSAMYPVTHYTRRVPMRTIHLYTLVQVVCLLVLCAVNISPNKILQILFPVFIAFLVPVRALLPLWFREKDLAFLDAGENPDAEETHWL